MNYLKKLVQAYREKQRKAENRTDRRHERKKGRKKFFVKPDRKMGRQKRKTESVKDR